MAWIFLICVGGSELACRPQSVLLLKFHLNESYGHLRLSMSPLNKLLWQWKEINVEKELGAFKTEIQRRPVVFFHRSVLGAQPAQTFNWISSCIRLLRIPATLTYSIQCNKTKNAAGILIRKHDLNPLALNYTCSSVVALWLMLALLWTLPSISR